LNVAHKVIDLALAEKRHNKVPGAHDRERKGFQNVLDAGFIDTWRKQNEGVTAYSFWTYKFKSREKNQGWRLDYWVVSKDFFGTLGETFIRSEVVGSDHVPIGLLLAVPK